MCIVDIERDTNIAIYTYIHYLCRYIYIQAHMCVYTYTHIYIYLYIYVYIYMCIYVYIYICINIWDPFKRRLPRVRNLAIGQQTVHGAPLRRLDLRTKALSAKAWAAHAWILYKRLSMGLHVIPRWNPMPILNMAPPSRILTVGHAGCYRLIDRKIDRYIDR